MCLLDACISLLMLVFYGKCVTCLCDDRSFLCYEAISYGISAKLGVNDKCALKLRVN